MPRPATARIMARIYGVLGHAAGDPGAGAEFAHDLDVAHNRADVNDNAQDDDGYPGPDGDSRGVVGRHTRVAGLKLA